jgi:hypothetical protein
MREKAKACATIRAALAEANIDAAQNDGVRCFASAEREVSRWPDTPELQRADADFIAQDPKLTPRESLAAQAAGRAALRRPPTARSADHVARRLVRLVAGHPLQRGIAPTVTLAGQALYVLRDGRFAASSG